MNTRSVTIRASDVPQWTWSNAQCQRWVAAVLVEYYCKDRKEAERLASQFKSFGPGLWRLGAKDWHTWFGPGGGVMFDFMFAMYRKRSPGSVPTEIRLAHFEPDAGSALTGVVARY